MLEVPSPSVTHAPPPAEAVAPLLRGLDVLRRLTDADGTLALAELARATGLARSTVDRICATLAHLGYLRLDGRDASLAPPLMAVANACLDALRVPELLGPLADRLADALDESVSIAVPDGDDIRFVHQVLRRRALSISFRVGDPLPGDGSAPGLVFRRGAAPAVDDQLVEPGLIAVAMPVRGPSGETVCAVSVVSHTSRHSAEGLAQAVRGALSACVREMEDVLRDAAGASGLRPGPRSSNAGGAENARASLNAGGTENARVSLNAGEAENARVSLNAGEAENARASLKAGGAENAPVQALARGLSLLTVFGAERPALTLTEIAEATGLSRATARRALITYAHLGYVRQDGRVHRLTPRVLGLGCAPLSRTTLPRIAEPHLAALSDTLGESVGLSVADGESVRCTARIAPRRVMSVDIGVGTRLPAAATAAGRVLSGESEEAVADGPEDGLWSVAVPLRGRDGRIVSALDVTAHRGRGEAVAWAAALRATAARIEAELRVTSRFVTVPHL